MLKQLLCLVLTLPLFLAACGGSSGGGSPTPPTLADWTYMVYMGADNNLSDLALSDLREMSQVGSTANVNVVVQTEFSSFYTDPSSTEFNTFYTDPSGTYNGDTLRVYLTKNFTNNIVQPIGNVDMASPQTLTDFITWAATNFPAEKYALVIWDHGDGWKTTNLARGAVAGETSGSFMSLPELAQGVRDAEVPLEVLDFDACLMGMYEVAYEFIELVDYMVFSEENEPGYGNPYDTILAHLTTNPAMDGKTLAQTVVSDYVNYYVSSSYPDVVTKSAIDMALLPELHTLLGNLAENVISEFDSVSAAVTQAISNSQHYAYYENHDLYDFCYRLASNLVSGATKNSAQAIIDFYNNNDLIVANKFNGAGVANSHGLAIYIPSSTLVSTDGQVDTMAEYETLHSNSVDLAAYDWADAVTTIIGANIESLKLGGFKFYVEWDSDADIDLMVWEPNDLYAAWMGLNTPNGFFSGDSLVTGESAEYYISNDYIQEGPYDVLIYYYDNGPTSTSANVTFHYYDPEIDNNWHTLGPMPMSLANPYPDTTLYAGQLNYLDSFSDWWYPLGFTRLRELSPLGYGNRAVRLTLPKAKSPLLEQSTRD